MVDLNFLIYTVYSTYNILLVVRLNLLGDKALHSLDYLL